jgi:hypothetical protein
MANIKILVSVMTPFSNQLHESSLMANIKIHISAMNPSSNQLYDKNP